MLHKSKCSIFHNIFKYMIFHGRQKVLLWSKGLMLTDIEQEITREKQKVVHSVFFHEV